MYLFPKVTLLPFSHLMVIWKPPALAVPGLAACRRQGQADWLPPASWLAAALTGLPGLAFLSNAQVHQDALEIISLDTIDD